MPRSPKKIRRRRADSPTPSRSTTNSSEAPEGKSPADFGDRGFPIVGIGASAGGLEAFSELLKHLPLDTGMGFVLVQHLDPQYESALTELLAKTTALPGRPETTNGWSPITSM